MGNHVLNQLQNRKSIRHFTGERISEEDLSIIFQTAQRAPTSINGQQISLVYTRDKAKLTRIAKLCNEQAHIATADVFVGIVIGFNRTSAIVESVGRNHIIEQSDSTAKLISRIFQIVFVDFSEKSTCATS